MMEDKTIRERLDRVLKMKSCLIKKEAWDENPLSCPYTINELDFEQAKAELVLYVDNLIIRSKGYSELLLCVENKYQDETRHETAVRLLSARPTPPPAKDWLKDHPETEKIVKEGLKKSKLRQIDEI